MAIEHLSFRIFGRSHRANAVMKAAYRAGCALYDEQHEVTYNFDRKAEVAHTGILAPPDAPTWVHDRAQLWNTVERVERRRDAQLAREFVVALPQELSLEQQRQLLTGYLQDHFVSLGMVADYAIHAKEGNPHAHVMLTLRTLDGERFGKKARAWNSPACVTTWRQAWELAANRALESAGSHARIDMRSFEDRGLALEPGVKHYRPRDQAATDRRAAVAEGLADSAAVARRNGARLLAQPELVLELLTTRQSVFTEHELLAVVHRHTADAAQFERVRLAVLRSPELARLSTDDERPRFTTRSVLALEQSLVSSADALHRRAAHQVNPYLVEAAIAATIERDPARAPNREQVEAVQHLARSGDIAVLQGYAGSGKSTTLRMAREALEAQGYTVVGGALAGKAAEGLTGSAGIRARTLASWEYAWSQGRDLLTPNHVLVIDEAGMLGTAQMAGLLKRAEQAGAKVVLVGDTRQLAAIEPGSPMALLQERLGAARLTEVVRQREDWQRAATKQFGDGRAAEALEAYASAGRFHRHASRDEARAALVARWSADRKDHPGASSILLAFRRTDVRALNEAARAVRKAAGELGPERLLMTHDGPRAFSAEDRIVFLKNDRKLGVSNGTLATVVAIEGLSLTARTDDGALITINTASYLHLDHGYASTIHKSQGATVDRAYVLASRHMDAAAAYVALSRHRAEVELHWDGEEFASSAALVKRLATVRSAPMALEEALTSETTRGDEQDDLFALLTEEERTAFLARLELHAQEEPTSSAKLFDQLPEVVAARKDHKRADEECRQAAQALEAYRAKHPLAAKVKTPDYRRAVDQLAAAQSRLLVLGERLSEVEADPALRARADVHASDHNTAIRNAATRLGWFRASGEHQARRHTLNRLVALTNAQLGRTTYRTATPADAGRRMEVALIRRVTNVDLVVLRPTDGAGHLIAVDARDFPAVPARGASVVLAPSGAPKPERSHSHGPVRDRSE
jgi:Ti-type conjugative transfer relaxase TraA